MEYAMRSLSLATVATVVHHVACRRDSEPALTYNRGNAKLRALVERCPSLAAYTPPLIPSLGGLTQTLWTGLRDAATLPVRRRRALWRTERIELPAMDRREGALCCPKHVPAGVVSLDWAIDPRGGDGHASVSSSSSSNERSGSSRAPIVVISPGLTSDSSSGYVYRAVAEIQSGPSALRVCVYNPRSRGGNEVKTPFLYSAGYTGDLERVLLQLRRREPSTPIFAIGFSLGSNVLAKLIGEMGNECPLAAALCLACPLDCVAMSAHLCGSFRGKLLDPALVAAVQSVATEHEVVIAQHPGIDLPTVRRAKTMREFDAAAIAPMMGEEGAGAYYANASAGPHLASIRIPTLFIHAVDDPITPGALMPIDRFDGPLAGGAPIVHAMTSEGGHSMDWWSGWRGAESWGARVAAEWIAAQCHDMREVGRSKL